MFEDLKNKDIQPIEAVSEKHSAENSESQGINDAEDIFRDIKGLDKASVQDDARPVLNEVVHSGLPDLDMEDAESSGTKKKIIFLSIGVLLIFGLISFFVLINTNSIVSRFKGNPAKNEEDSAGMEKNDTTAEENKNIPEDNKPQPTPGNVPVKDDDGDGLTNEEEIKLGTSPNAIDTDKDGLSDREEIKVYKTDPLNPDSDGDGYRDGDEVKNGYDPKGPGKLLEVKPGR